ncbi:MAG: 4Fe-4S binding protein [Actinomycetota bacterium]|nr:4Fe-4S binding protein [Actinomycetota bacterium]
MLEDEVYSALAEHLDGMPVGFPPSEERLEILRVLFEPEEARLAARLPYRDTPLPDIAAELGMPEDELQGALDAMASRGIVYKELKDGVASYRLVPGLMGLREAPFWTGRDTEEARRLADLWLRYFRKAWGREIADRELPLVRVVPLEEDIDEAAEILPFETAKELVEQASFRAVSHCACRTMAAYAGGGCDHERENCFHFGSFGRFLAEQGMGWEISLEESVRKLEEAREAGLIFLTDNYQGEVNTLCCCCSCCCVFMRGRLELRFDNAVNTSSYLARVDRETCVGCGECEERCPVGAVGLDEHELARVDRRLCLGCGVCVTNCTGGAIALKRRDETTLVPTREEFMASMRRK